MLGFKAVAFKAVLLVACFGAADAQMGMPPKKKPVAIKADLPYIACGWERDCVQA
jgi:hypothetical protein